MSTLKPKSIKDLLPNISKEDLENVETYSTLEPFGPKVITVHMKDLPIEVVSPFLDHNKNLVDKALKWYKTFLNEFNNKFDLNDESIENLEAMESFLDKYNLHRFKVYLDKTLFSIYVQEKIVK